MKLEELLREYNKVNQGPILSLNPEGVCQFVINGELVVALEKIPEKEGFYLYSAIGPIPEEKLKEVALRALSGNLFHKETGLAAIGYLPEARSLILFDFLLERETGFPDFDQRLNQFVDVLTYWTREVEAETLRSDLPLSEQMQKDGEGKKMKIFFA